MTMTDAALWVILVLLIALIPIGCFMTRPKPNEPHQKEDVMPIEE